MKYNFNQIIHNLLLLLLLLLLLPITTYLLKFDIESQKVTEFKLNK